MSIFDKIKEKLTHYTWDLAYFDYNHDVIVNGLDFNKIHIVKNPYRKKWFADPFILKNTEKELTLLVEEFDSDVKRGRIAEVVIDKCKNLIVSCEIILDLSTHLSFPVIYRINNKVIVHPENSASGASYIYFYDEKTKKLINPIKISNEPITDAVIIKNGDTFMMYATCVPDSNGSVLRIYKAKEFMGKYEPASVEYFPCNRARMAGNFFYVKGKNVRPAQDCNGAYGKAVVFYDGDEILGEIRPNSYKYAGVHTFNVFGDIGIIDIKRNDYPLFVLIKDFFKKIL